MLGEEYEKFVLESQQYVNSPEISKEQTALLVYLRTNGHQKPSRKYSVAKCGDSLNMELIYRIIKSNCKDCVETETLGDPYLMYSLPLTLFTEAIASVRMIMVDIYFNISISSK